MAWKCGVCNFIGKGTVRLKIALSVAPLQKSLSSSLVMRKPRLKDPGSQIRCILSCLPFCPGFWKLRRKALKTI